MHPRKKSLNFSFALIVWRLISHCFINLCYKINYVRKNRMIQY